MFRMFLTCLVLFFGAGLAVGQEQGSEQEQPQPQAEAPDPEQAKTMSGMSILGNEEAPKSLVIVPWKSSELGTEVGVSSVLDDRAQPVDKEVFMRELSYYSIIAEEAD